MVISADTAFAEVVSAKIAEVGKPWLPTAGPYKVASFKGQEDVTYYIVMGRACNAFGNIFLDRETAEFACALANLKAKNLGYIYI